jgi:teichuronic acid exporter
VRKEEALRGFGWNAFFTLVNRIGLPLVNVVLAALIGPAGFGDYAALNSTYVIIELFREAGLGITFIADREISPERERTYNFISVLNGLAFASILFFGRAYAARTFAQPALSPALAVLSLGMIFASIGTVPLLKLTRAARFRDTGLIDTATNVTSMVVAVVAFKLGAGFMSLVYQMVTRSILFCVITSTISRSAWGMPSWHHTKEIMSKAIANMGSNIAYTVYTMGDYILVRTVLGPAANGLYTFAFNIANKPVEIVTGPLRQTMFVALTRYHDEPERLRRNFGRALSAAILLSMPVYAVILFHAPAVIRVFPGSAFDEAAPILKILCAYLFMRSIGTMASVALVAAGRERWTVYGWIPAYIVAIAYIAFHWTAISAIHIDPGAATVSAETFEALRQIVTGLTLGAICCYSTYLIASFQFVRPPADVVGRVISVVITGLISAAGVWAASLIPAPEYGRLAIAIVGVAVIQLALISQLFLESPFAAFSKTGLKRVYHAL